MIGQSVGSDVSPLSCFLFRPRKSREKCRKRSHTNVSNASVTRASRVSQTLLHPPSLLPSMGITHQKGLGTIVQNGLRSLSRVKVGTHSAFGGRSHTAAHTAKHGAFRMGVVSLLSERSARSQTSPGRVSERRTLPLWGLGQGCSQRTQRAFGTAMRLCASLSRGVAAPLGCVIFFAFVEIAACTPCAQSFPRVQGGERYHYPRRALHVLETLDGRLSKRLVCRFLRSMGIAPRATPIFLRIYRYSCR